MTTWVLLRGLMREARHWGEFPHQLQKVIGDDDIVCLDFPGNGALFKQSSLTTIPEMARHCRQQLQAKGCEPPYHVLAISPWRDGGRGVGRIIPRRIGIDDLN